MKSLRGRLAVMMAAGALVIVPATNTRLPQAVGARGNPDPKTLYDKGVKEFYLSAEDYGYVRPGLKITVNSITITRRCIRSWTISFTDDCDQPLDRLGASPRARSHQP